jgi:hypothetical protein
MPDAMPQFDTFNPLATETTVHSYVIPHFGIFTVTVEFEPYEASDG